MKIKRYLIFLLAISLSGCAAIPSKTVTLVGEEGNHFVGILNYDGPYSGVLTVENGPNGELFSGRFTVIDRTAVQKYQSSIVIPQGNQVPAIGAAGGSSSGNVDASGFWYAIGDKGSKMDCELIIGLGGHGYGVCKHSNGVKYKIVL